MHRVDLARKADEVLADLDDRARAHVLALIDSVAEEPDDWPTAGTWELAEEFTDRAWIMYIAHADGIEVLDIGWLAP
ncbi:hypothetical protein ACIBUY_04015 [Streptomyces sp. NPDC050085]|uniref:hypothetical protein n=1 Tax=Streptomyces sp. NPDC050085 TaxID=3365600 RepID=UPI0037950638